MPHKHIIPHKRALCQETERLAEQAKQRASKARHRGQYALAAKHEAIKAAMLNLMGRYDA